MTNKTIIIGLLVFFNAYLFSAQLTINKVDDLPKRMLESSGLVLIDDVLVTHNDGGNNSKLYVLSRKGKFLKSIKVNGAKNIDWEDLALDNDGNLYIGDFGNNLNERRNLKIHRIDKGFLKLDEVEVETIFFSYEDQKTFPPKSKNLHFDCEAFICKNGKIFLYTKSRSKPYSGISKIYILPSRPGRFEAKLIGQFQFCNLGWFTCSVTAADYHHKTNTLAILTYSRLYLIKNFRFNAFWKGDIKSYKIPKIRQREAICFDKSQSWFMTDEYRKGFKGGKLYHLKLKKK